MLQLGKKADENAELNKKAARRATKIEFDEQVKAAVSMSMISDANDCSVIGMDQSFMTALEQSRFETP